MKILRLLKTASPEASLITISACAVLVIKILLLNRYPAMFYGAFEIGLVFEAILASIIASYVFYIFVVHLKELKERDVFEPYFKNHSTRIISDCVMCLKELSEKSGEDLNFFTATNEQMIAALLKTDPSRQANLYLGNLKRHALIQEYFWHTSERSRASCKLLLEKLNFLTAEETKLISDIDECSYFKTAEHIQNQIIKNTDCSFLISSLTQYVNACRRLNHYPRSIGLITPPAPRFSTCV